MLRKVVRGKIYHDLWLKTLKYAKNTCMEAVYNAAEPLVSLIYKLTSHPFVFPGEREPGEGERRAEEGGEAADRGGQVSVLCADQPRAPVHRPGSSDPRPPLPSSSRQLPPAHHRTTLPALT